MPRGAQRTEREEATDFLQPPSRANLNSVRSFTRPHFLKVTALTMTYGAMVTRDLRGTYSEHGIVHPVSLSSMELWYIIQSDNLTMTPPVLQGSSFCPLCTTASHTYHLLFIPPSSSSRPVLYQRPLLCNPSPRSG